MDAAFVINRLGVVRMAEIAVPKRLLPCRHGLGDGAVGQGHAARANLAVRPGVHHGRMAKLRGGIRPGIALDRVGPHGLFLGDEDEAWREAGAGASSDANPSLGSRPAIEEVGPPARALPPDDVADAYTEDVVWEDAGTPPRGFQQGCADRFEAGPVRGAAGANHWRRVGLLGIDGVDRGVAHAGETVAASVKEGRFLQRHVHRGAVVDFKAHVQTSSFSFLASWKAASKARRTRPV